MKLSLKASQRLWTFAFLVVPLSVYFVVVIGPLLATAWLSLTSYTFSAFAPPEFAGLVNYERLTGDDYFHTSLKNTLIWMVAALILPTGGGLILALLLHGRVRGANVFKSLFYLPITISMIVIAQTWQWMYQPDWGLLNTLLKTIGVEKWKVFWLSTRGLALGAIIFAWSWQQVGLSMVIFLAGLTSLPGEMLEAAQIDGANYRQSLRRIVIPLLLPSSVVVIALAVINSLRSFDLVWVLNEGGSGSSTLAVQMYRETFKSLRAGYGSAVSMVLFAIAVIIIVFYFRRVRRLEHLYD
ncbi:MAG: sugar ABC transporter permease [Anaerolineaceae bacterium]|nr:sugar ABC transporter permease [Anaerolineaceae bacterium]